MRWILFFSLAFGLNPRVFAVEPTVFPPNGVQSFLGLDDTSVPTQVQDGRAQDLQNVTLSISKDLKKRDGFSVIGQNLDAANEANCAVTGLYYTKFSSGTERIVSTCGNRFYYLNGAIWNQVSGIVVSGTLVSPANSQFVFTTALDEIMMTNDNAITPLRYDGTNLTAVNFTGLSSTSVPTQARVVAFFKNYLILGNTLENGIRHSTRLRWSNVGDTATWSDEDFIDIGALSGQEITAIAELYDNLYIFLTDSIYRVSYVAGADTYQISKVTDKIGCIAKNSVQTITLTNAQNGLVFLSKDRKIYFFDGIAPHDISSLITTVLSGLNAARLPYAVSATTNTDYYLCATSGSGSENNLCLDFEYQIGEWTKHTNIDANAIASVLDNNSLRQVYFGTDSSFVYQLQNSALHSDVYGVQRQVANVDNNYATSTATGLEIIYTTGDVLVSGSLVGAPLEVLSGTGQGGTATVLANTISGIVVVSPLSVTPASDSVVQTGAIDASYTTKWYDMGAPFRLKQFGELYFWAEASTNTGLLVSYATDFSSDVTSGIISLSADTGDAIWGSAIWGINLWGNQSDIFRNVKQTASGRFVRMKWSEGDINQPFHLYGWNEVYWLGGAF